MAVAFDAVGPSSSGATSTTSPLTWSHTCGASATELLVGVAVDSGADGALVASVTYNSVTMTSVKRWESGGSTQAFGFIELFHLASPPTGAAHTVSVSVTGGSPDHIAGGSVSFTGSSSLGTPVTADSNSANVTSGSVVIASTSASNMVAGFAADGSGGLAFTAGTSQYISATGSGTGAAFQGAAATAAGTGSNVTISWTQTSDFYGAVGVEVQIASGVTASAGLAAATGVPYQPVISYTAGLASATGAALQPAAQVTALAGLAAATGTAYNPVFMGFSTATGVALPPVAQVTALAGLAAATGVPYQAFISYTAGLAAGIGVPYQPAISYTAGLAAATGTSRQPTITAGLPFATSVSGRNFLDQTGKPIFVKGDASWAIIPNSGQNGGATTYQTDMAGYLSARATQGYNALYTALLPSTVNGAATNGQTWDGVTPFSGGIGTLNNTYWTRVDYLVQQAQAQGVTLFLNPAYGNFSIEFSLTGWTAGQATTYGTSLGNRYKSYPNIVWTFGGDYNGGYDTQMENVVSALAAAGDTHLVSIENYDESSSRYDGAGSATPAGDNLATWNFIYTYNAQYVVNQQAWQENTAHSVSVLPTLMGENSYYTSGSNDTLCRTLEWWNLTSGSQGSLNASNGTYLFASTVLTTVSSETFMTTVRPTMWNYFTGLAGWQNLVPDLNSAFVTAGRGTYASNIVPQSQNQYSSGNTYVTAAKTADGMLAVVYLPNAASAITISQALLGPGYTATWVDPLTAATTSATTGATYSHSGTNSAGGSDWVLVFQSPVPVLSVAQVQPGSRGWRRRYRRSQAMQPQQPAVSPNVTVTAGLATATGTASPLAFTDLTSVPGLADPGQLSPGDSSPVFGIAVTAFAGTAAAAGAAYQPVISYTAGLAAATGIAYLPGGGRVPATAAATGTAYLPGWGPVPGLAVATGVLYQPVISYTARLASATGAAYLPGWGPVPATAIATGTAPPPAFTDLTSVPGLASPGQLSPGDLSPVFGVAVIGSSGLAAATGTAYNPSVAIGTDITATAGRAAATGVPYQPFISYTAGLAAAIGSIYVPFAGPFTAGTAVATGTALSLFGGMFSPGTAAATGTAGDAFAALNAVTGFAGTAAAAGTAPQAFGGPFTAGTAAGTGTAVTAFAALNAVTGFAGTAAATGTAPQAFGGPFTVGTAAAIGTAGDAFAALSAVTGFAGTAAAAGTALQPPAQTTVSAGLAAAIGAAYLPGAGRAPGAASATGVPYQPVISYTAGLASATGTVPLTFGGPFTGGKAAGTGSAYNPAVILRQPFSVTASVTNTIGAALALKVLVVTGAAETGGASTGGTAFGTASISLTPVSTGSLPVFGLYNSSNNTTFTAAASNTFLDNRAATASVQADGYYSGTVTAGTPVTVGASAPSGAWETIGVYELLALGGIPAVDASTPALATGTGSSLTTASFNPPASGTVALAVIMMSQTSATGTVTVSDTAGVGLVWTKRADSQSSHGNVTIFTAEMPVGGTVALSGCAVATGAAYSAATARTLAAASGTGAAYQSLAAVTATAGTAAATGSAWQLTAAVTVTAGSAAATGAALGPSISTGGTTTAAAVPAAGSGTAPQPAAAVVFTAGNAAATGTAYLSGAGRAPGAAGATGAGSQASSLITAFAGLAAATGTAYSPSVIAGGDVSTAAGLASGTGAAYQSSYVVVSPVLTVSGFGTFPQVPVNDAIILYVIANIIIHGSDAAMAAPTYELWDGTSSRIGIQQGTASTSAAHRDSVVFTGVVQSQLATLQLRIFAASLSGNTGAVSSVDAVSLSVSWVENTDALVIPAVLAVKPGTHGPVVSGVVNATARPAVLAVTPGHPLADSAGLVAVKVFASTLAVRPVVRAPAVHSGTLVKPGVLSVTPVLPAVIDVTQPGWAGAETTGGGWANPGNVTGPPDGQVATWIVP